MNDLVHDLRNYECRMGQTREGADLYGTPSICEEAADHIEAQNKLIEEMREALSEAKSWIGECYRAWAPDGVPVPDDVPYPSGHTSRMGHISAALSKPNQMEEK